MSGSNDSRIDWMSQTPIEWLMLFSILILLISALLQQTFLIANQTLYASILFALLNFYLTSLFLRKQKVGIERYFIAVASMVSGIWLFEVVYRIGYGYTLSQFLYGLTTLNFNTTGAQFPMLWALLMMALPLAGVKYMRINWLFFSTMAFGLAAFWVWVNSGYAQFLNPQWWPQLTPLINLIPLAYAHTSNPAVVETALVFNSITKILSLAPAFLFYPCGSKRWLKGLVKELDSKIQLRAQKDADQRSSVQLRVTQNGGQRPQELGNWDSFNFLSASHRARTHVRICTSNWLGPDGPYQR